MPSVDNRNLLEHAARRGADYLDNLNDRPVYPAQADIERLQAALDIPMPNSGCNGEDVIEFIDTLGSPATVASAGGRYFGFVTGGALPCTVASNWLASAWDQNGFSMTSSPAIALFEQAALTWLKEVLVLPPELEGTLVTGGTMANFSCLAAARHAVLDQVGWDVESQGLAGAPEITLIAGQHAHASIYKVLALLGLGTERVQTVEVDDQGRIIAHRIPQFTGPTIVCLQSGNVNSGAFDPAAEIIPALREKGAWVHVDGAFGLWARASAQLSHLAAGVELADSWATDAHKWLNVPYDCGVALVRNPDHLRAAMSKRDSYLMPGDGREAIDFTPDNSRRARAIDVWAALMHLGKQGIATLVERNCAQATAMAQGLARAGIEVLNDVVLNQVIVSFGSDDRTRAVMEGIQAEGVCWCSGTKWQGKAAMRISFSSWATSQADLERSMQSIIDADNAVKGK
jgi:glutamate/tyrosine decarboxylase-like PLP-dependent enzyme